MNGVQHSLVACSNNGFTILRIVHSCLSKEMLRRAIQPAPDVSMVGNT